MSRAVTIPPVGKPTPGPWRIEPRGKGVRGHWLHDDDGEYVAMVCRRENGAEETANARLIAAALIETLVEAGDALIADVRRRYPGEELRCEHMRRLDAALTAAKGE